MKNNIKFGSRIVTLGLDVSKTCALCLQNINNIKCVAIYEVDKEGYTSFSKDKFIAAIPIDKIDQLNLRIINFI